jgi:hypothetical protein
MNLSTSMPSIYHDGPLRMNVSKDADADFIVELRSDAKYCDDACRQASQQLKAA